MNSQSVNQHRQSLNPRIKLIIKIHNIETNFQMHLYVYLVIENVLPDSTLLISLRQILLIQKPLGNDNFKYLFDE